MSVVSSGHGHAAQAVAWPPDAQYGSATPGKLGMWIFLLSDGFSFAALLLAMGILRGGGGEAWRAPGEPALGQLFTGLLTVVLLASSATCALAHRAAVEGRPAAVVRLLGATAALGGLFVLGQVQEWFGIWGRGLVAEGLVFGRSARASTFYVVTGFHGLHVVVGVVWLLAALAGWARGRGRPERLELLGLYWSFVDFVWVFVFSFVYLFP